MNLASMVFAMTTAAVLATAAASAQATERYGSAQDECFSDVVARSGRGAHGLGHAEPWQRRDVSRAEFTRPVDAQLLDIGKRHDTFWRDTAWSQREWAAEPLQWSQVIQAVNALEGLWGGIGQIRITADRVDVFFRFDRSVTPATPVTPVPEAGTTALMLAGLGVLAWGARRRAKVARSTTV